MAILVSETQLEHLEAMASQTSSHFPNRTCLHHRLGHLRCRIDIHALFTAGQNSEAVVTTLLDLQSIWRYNQKVSLGL